MLLSTKAAIDRLFQQGRRWNAGRLKFFVLPSRELAGRLAIIVPKKAYRKSVDRNRIKRLIRESWRKQNKPGGWDLLILTQPGIDVQKAKQKDIEEWIIAGLQKAPRLSAPASGPKPPPS